MEHHHGSEGKLDSRKRPRPMENGKEEKREPKRHRSPLSHSDKLERTRLPLNSHHLHKHDFDSYREVFADYLDLQKGLDIDQLHERELKGRWKSFLNKWNWGELAEGWYDPAMKTRADLRASVTQLDHAGDTTRQSHKRTRHNEGGSEGNEEHDADGDYGPSLPSKEILRKIGPTVPNSQDLQQRREQQEEDRGTRIADLRYERKQDRNVQKERLEELAPRAAPGSRERQLEKKKDVAISNKAFADAKESGAEEVAEGDLLGDDGVDSYKAKVRAGERKKNERELRKEEVLRTRAAEREEKLAEHRRKEAKTMEMLKTIAQQNFGGGS